jgi:hypothetical protein
MGITPMKRRLDSMEEFRRIAHSNHKEEKMTSKMAEGLKMVEIT